MFVSWSNKNAAHKWSDFAVKVLFCETASRTTRWCIQRRLSGMSPMQTHSTTTMQFWLLSSLPRTHSPRWKNSTNLTQHPKSIQIPAFRPDIIFVRISISKWFLFSRFQNNGDLWMLRWMPLVEVLQEPSPPWTRQLGATFSPTCLLMSTRRRWWTSSFAWERTVDHHLFQIKMYDYGRLALSWLPNVGKIAPNCDSKWFGYLCDDIWCCTWYILQNVRRSSCTCVSPAEGWDLLLVRWSCQPCCMLHGLHVK